MAVVTTYRDNRNGVQRLTGMVRNINEARRLASKDDADRFAYATGKSLHYYHRIPSGNFVKGQPFTG